MSDVLLVEIEFNSKTWYLSEEGYIGENYYAPYLSKSPSLELGEVKGGYIGVRLGDLSIANRSNDRFSPFSIFGGGYQKLLSNPNQKIPVNISWEQHDIIQSLFDGTMYLSGFNTDEFNFLLEDKIEDVDLLSQARDYNSSFVSVNSISIRGVNTYGYVIAPDHGLITGDFIKVSGSSINAFNTLNNATGVIEPVRITVVDDNHFTYNFLGGLTSTAFERSSEYLMETYTKKPQPFSFGVINRKKDIILIDERPLRDNLGDYSFFEYSNPDLDPNNAEYPILLFDDGVLVGSSDQNRSGRILNGLEVIGVTRNVDSLTLETADKHNLLIGSTVSLSGFTPNEVNTSGAFYVVSDVRDPDSIADGGSGPWTFNVFARLPTDLETIQTGSITGTANTSGLVSGRHEVKEVPSSTEFKVIYNSTTYTITTTVSHSLSTGRFITLAVSGTSVTIKSIVEAPGEYFGPDRLPTNETIYSRAYWVDLLTWDNVPRDGLGNPDPTDPAYPNYVRTLDSVPLTARDGTAILGTPLVSGISRNGETLSDFFEYVARKVGVTNVDFSDAPNASSLKLQIWQTAQTKTIEFAGEIAYAANYLFEIKNDILRVIDRGLNPSVFKVVNNWEIIEATYKMPTPVKALRAKWVENIATSKTIPTSLTTREESVMISNMASGEILDITPISEDSSVIETVLLNIKNTINKNVITLKVGRIRDDILVGDRIKANRDEDGVSIDMIVRTIKYNFSELDTELVGDGSLVVIEQDQIY